MFSTAIVALDGSALAARALPCARRLAQAGTTLVLVRASVPPDEVASMPTHYAYLPAREQAHLARLRAQSELQAAVEALEGLAVTSRLVDAPAATAIAEAAASEAADLIVMSTHGHGGLGRLLFGSVTDEVVRGATVPVLVVPAACTHTWPVGQPLRVIVPLDGSPLAAEALGPAAELLATLGGELILLGVIEPDAGYYPDALVHVQAEPLRETAEAARYLDGVAANLDSARVRVQVASGGAAAAIVRAASEVGADAIAMATQGRGGLARVLLGSVATATLQQAHVPLLLRRPAAQTRPNKERDAAFTSSR